MKANRRNNWRVRDDNFDNNTSSTHLCTAMTRWEISLCNAFYMWELRQRSEFYKSLSHPKRLRRTTCIQFPSTATPKVIKVRSCARGYKNKPRTKNQTTFCCWLVRVFRVSYSWSILDHDLTRVRHLNPFGKIAFVSTKDMKIHFSDGTSYIFGYLHCSQIKRGQNNCSMCDSEHGIGQKMIHLVPPTQNQVSGTGPPAYAQTFHNDNQTIHGLLFAFVGFGWMLVQ